MLQAALEAHASEPTPPRSPCRCEDLPPIGRAALRFQRVVMVIPPVLDDKGKFSAGGALNGFLLPLLHDLQRLGPPCPAPFSNVLKECRASLEPSEIGG